MTPSPGPMADAAASEFTKLSSTPDHRVPQSVTAGAHASPVRPLGRLGGRIGGSGVRLASGLTLVVLWYLGSLMLPSSVLPGPIEVLAQAWANLADGSILPHIQITLLRTLGAFALAMTVALVLGLATGLSQRAERYFDVWLVVGMTVPALVTIILVFMVVGLNERAAILAAALPSMAMLTINVKEGIKNIDTRLIGMSRAFRVPQRDVIRHVVLPQVAPTLLASARFGLGLVWKMILFVELLGRSDGMGYQIQFYYSLFDMTQVLAYAVTFLAVMLFIEIACFGMLERRLLHWRPSVQQA